MYITAAIAERASSDIRERTSYITIRVQLTFSTVYTLQCTYRGIACASMLCRREDIASDSYIQWRSQGGQAGIPPPLWSSASIK